MWRESLEAALIVGILLTYLARSGERAGMRYVWAGALGAVLAAGVAGAGLAVATAWLFFRGFAFLNLQTFFRVTGILLLLVAAGLLTAGVNKLIGLGYLSPIKPQVWNTAWLLREDSLLGALLGALIGYRSRPSLLEVLAFLAYLPAMGWALHRADLAARGAAEQAPARSAA